MYFPTEVSKGWHLGDLKMMMFSTFDVCESRGEFYKLSQENKEHTKICKQGLQLVNPVGFDF